MDIRELITFQDDHMLVEVHESEQRDLVIIQSKLTEKIQTGTVVLAGPGRIRPDGSIISMDVKMGDDVVFAGGISFKIDGASYKLITESHVLMHREGGHAENHSGT